MSAAPPTTKPHDDPDHNTAIALDNPTLLHRDEMTCVRDLSRIAAQTWFKASFGACSDAEGVV
jgi:hypothetical protein